MTDRMSHDDYVRSCRTRAAEIAAAVLAGTLPLLEGCHLLDELRSGVKVPDNDPDFAVFNLVQSETDTLPVGRVSQHWAAAALASAEAELQSAAEWAGPIALPACESVSARFGA